MLEKLRGFFTGTYTPLRYNGGKTYFVRMESYKHPGFFQRLSRLLFNSSSRRY
jgi:hypothetical protein